jgi:hypothetical protein
MIKGLYMENIELKLTTCGPKNHRAVAFAIATWCDIAATAALSREIRITIEGGPYFTAQEMRDLWQELLPPGAVDDLLIGGRSINAECDAGNMASPVAQRARRA